MADVNRGERPLSPHLQIYRPQITSILSILHRITGVGLLLATILVIWWFVAAATSPEAFAVADGFLTGPFGGFLLLGSLFAFNYHLLNGIRHLVWDMGYGFELDNVTASGWLVVVGSAALTGAIWLFFIMGGA